MGLPLWDHSTSQFMQRTEVVMGRARLGHGIHRTEIHVSTRRGSDWEKTGLGHSWSGHRHVPTPGRAQRPQLGKASSNREHGLKMLGS